MQDKSELTPGREESSALSDALDLIAVSRLAANGDIEEAETLLYRTGNPPSSCAALDFLARIAVQRGQFERARRLWLAVLEKDSAHEAANAALARLDSPWLVLAIIKRLGVVSAFAIVLTLAAVGVLALFRGQHFADSPRTPPPASVNMQSPTAFAPSRGDGLGVVSRKPPPFFSVPNATVSTNATETRIVFDEHLFASRCDFNESARARLEIAARTVAEHATDCWVIVEGHTDSDPMPANSIFRDNFDLGVQRALAVVKVLKETTPIPPQDILAASAGESAPLFSGDDYDTKVKNRTVVIRILPKPTGAPTTRGDGDESTR